MMSTTSATLNIASQRVITTIALESALATGLFGKASKPEVPISPSTPAAGPRSVLPQSEAACLFPSTVEGIVTMDCGVTSPKPGNRTLRARTGSALPTFAGSCQASAKTSPNVSGPKFKPGLNSNTQKRQLANQLTNKRHRYMTLIKELAEKEKQACKLYEQVAKLRDTAVAAGLKDPGEVESMGLDLGRFQLAEERGQAAQLNEQKSTADGQLEVARNRIRVLEGQSNVVATRLQQLQGTVKSLQVQLRQKETALEGRSKEMHRALKNNEGLVVRTEKQRESLESRITELKRKIDSTEAEHNRAVENLTKQLGDAKNQLAAERELKFQAERKARELGERCAKLEEKSKQLCDLAENTKGLSEKSDGNHTDTEQQLWNELQSTQSVLAVRDEKLVDVQREKDQMRSVLQQAADGDELGCVKDRLALKLLAKTEVLQKVVAERSKLQQDLKMALDKSDGSEHQHCELQEESGKSGWSAHAIQLQQELCDFRTILADLIRYNEKLETALTQKQLEVEQRDRVMQEQSKVLKVRDELIEVLKKRSPNANGDPNSPEHVALERQVQLDSEAINRLIAAKPEDLEALHRTLESKQMQLMRLEKVVQQMEDENERSQATRTKLEREVARLRLQLNEKNRDQRYVRRTTSSKVFYNQRNSRGPPPSVVTPWLPIGPIYSWRSPGPRARSVCSPTKSPERFTPISETPSEQNLKEIIHAVEKERTRGVQGSEGRCSWGASRSLCANPARNGTELREDLYNWLMQPAAGETRVVGNLKKLNLSGTRGLS